MAALAADLEAAFRAAVRVEDLLFRNWSGGGQWVFSIYERGDTYVGCVELVEATRKLRTHAPRYRNAKRQQKILDDLCVRFASILEAATPPVP